MKLFTKICLIVAAIAGGIGILAIILGLAMGADAEDLSSVGIYVSPHQQLDVSGVITEVVEESTHIYNDTGSKHHHNITDSFSGMKRLEVDVQNAQIIILSKEDSNDIIYYCDGKRNIAKVEGTTLRLKDETNIKNKIYLEIHVPVGVLKEIEIEAMNGTLTVDRLVADNVSIEIDNASVQIEELVVTNKAELQINAGQMVVGYYSGEGLETECAMGSIMVVCEGKPDDYNFELECGIGNVRVGENNYSGIGNDFKINNKSPKYINAECGMGEIILEFPNNL